MTNFNKIVSAFALVAVASTSAMAQTDFGSPIGAGSGVGGAIAPHLPGNDIRNPAARNAARPLPPGIRDRIAGVRSTLANSPTAGIRVVSPAGGTVVLSQSISQALAGVLSGSPTPAQLSAVIAAGVPSSVATALQAYGTTLTRGAHGAAVNAYNAAIDALPAGQQASPALLAVRAFLAGAGQRGTRAA